MSIAGMVGTLMLLLLLAGLGVGIALIVMSRRGSRRHAACGGCGYDISGSVGSVDRCPECGEMFTKVGVLPARKSPRPVMLGVGITLVALVLSCFGLSMAMTFTRATAVPAPPPPAAGTAVAPAPAPAPAADPAPPADPASSGTQ